MAKRGSSIQEELYEEPAGVLPGGMGFVSGDVAHPLPYPGKPVTRRGFLKAALITTAAVVVAGGLSWLGYEAARPKVEVNPAPIVQPAPNPSYPIQLTPTLDATQQYRSQITQYLMQDVPALAQDAKSFNYAVDRLTEWGTAWGTHSVDYQSIRAPLIKWIDANITWQNKGERLYPMSETDFLTDHLFDNSISVELLKVSDYRLWMENNVNYLVSNHDSLWKEMHDPARLKHYFDIADRATNKSGEISPATLEYFKRYKKTLWEQGTDADRISFATYGYSFEHMGASNEERRVPFTTLYLFSIGGEAQYSHMNFNRPGSHREPHIKISQQLQGIYDSDKATYGTPLDKGYLSLPCAKEPLAIDAANNTGEWGIRSVTKAVTGNSKEILLWSK